MVYMYSKFTVNQIIYNRIHSTQSHDKLTQRFESIKSYKLDAKKRNSFFASQFRTAALGRFTVDSQRRRGFELAEHIRMVLPSEAGNSLSETKAIQWSSGPGFEVGTVHLYQNPPIMVENYGF